MSMKYCVYKYFDGYPESLIAEYSDIKDARVMRDKLNKARLAPDTDYHIIVKDGAREYRTE